MTGFDSDRVRIELCAAMSVSFGSDPRMAATQCAEVWLSGDDGKIQRARKPALRLVGDSRPEILRKLATWIEENNDPGLAELATAYREAR